MSDLANAKPREKLLEKGLEGLHKELETMEKHQASPELQKSSVTCKFQEWESTSASNIAENKSLSRSSQK